MKFPGLEGFTLRMDIRLLEKKQEGWSMAGAQDFDMFRRIRRSTREAEQALQDGDLDTARAKLVDVANLSLLLDLKFEEEGG